MMAICSLGPPDEMRLSLSQNRTLVRNWGAEPKRDFAVEIVLITA